MNDKAIYLNFKFQTKYSLNDEIDKFSFFQNDLCQIKLFLFNLINVFHLKSKILIKFKKNHLLGMIVKKNYAITE